MGKNYFTGSDIMSEADFMALSVEQRRQVFTAATVIGLDAAQETVEAYLRPDTNK